MAMRFSKPTAGDRINDSGAQWSVEVGCDRCGTVLRSARDLPEDRVLDAHRRFGCRHS